MTSWQIWLALALLFVVVELFTMTFACFCIALGCLCAMAAALFDCALLAQLGAFSAGTALSFVFLFPLAKKWHNHTKTAVSNMDALVGRTGVVVEAISPQLPGRVKIDGDNWQARCSAGTPIAAGTLVKVVSYDSIVIEVVPAV